MEGVLPALSKDGRHWNDIEAVIRASDLLDWTKGEWILQTLAYIQHTVPLIVWAESADPTTFALWLGTT